MQVKHRRKKEKKKKERKKIANLNLGIINWRQLSMWLSGCMLMLVLGSMLMRRVKLRVLWVDLLRGMEMGSCIEVNYGRRRVSRLSRLSRSRIVI